MTYRVLLATLVTLALGSTVESARILGVFPLFAPSHHTIYKPILKALAEAGHEVVMYSPFPTKNPPPNYTDVIVDVKPPEEESAAFLKFSASTPGWKCLDLMLPVHELTMHPFFKNEKIKQLLNSNEKFDVIFTETYLGQEFTLVFGHYFNAPTIGIQTFFTTNLMNTHMGNSFSIPSIPEGCLAHTDKMSFRERCLNAFSILRGLYIYYNDYIPKLDAKIRKYYPDMPPVLELDKSVSLMFVNDHLTADYTQPRPPTLVPVSGIHLEKEKPLPVEFQKFMDEAKDGVILFSMGTLAPEPKEQVEVFAKVFSKFSQRVIWKSKWEMIEGLSDNVMLVNWMPQPDILTHPNCILFITHGGIASQIETIHAGVPVVGVPYFADQPRNVALYVAKEVGVRVLLSELTEETLTKAIRTVLEDPKYTSNMKKLSKIFRDRPMSPSESVVYWTEYVIRHGGAAHLKPSSTLLAWYQLFMVDIALAALTIVLTAAAVLYFVTRKLLSFIAGGRKPETSSRKKNN